MKNRSIPLKYLRINHAVYGVCRKIFAWMLITLWFYALSSTSAFAQAEYQPLDRIVAVVEDGVILASELNQKVDAIIKQLASQNTPLPPERVIRRQVLERMIIDMLQLQLANKSGIQVDDETLRQSIVQLAQQNNMSLEEFRLALRDEGISYANFIEDMRKEIIINRLRVNQINSQIKISDREIEHYLETQGKLSQEQNTEYRLGHILIATPEAASPTQVQKARQKAERIVTEIHNGLDFKQVALSVSDGAQALQGGDLGWRKLGQLPTLFVDLVAQMQEGEVQGPIRSPSGFHIIKLLSVKGAGKHLITQTHARHILIKTDELVNDEDARKRLLDLKQRIEKGEDFAALARAYSDDKASAVKGGDLGWVSPGALVPPFEQTMNRLAVNEISDPLQTQFGWHIIQVLGRQERDNTLEYQKQQAQEEIAKRRIEEETELWLRRLRDEAYVEIRLDEI